MFTSIKRNFKMCLLLAFVGIFILTLCVHRRLLKFPTLEHLCQTNSGAVSLSDNLDSDFKGNSKVMLMNPLEDLLEAANAPHRIVRQDESEQEVRKILKEIDELIPKVTFTHLDNTTCAEQSKASIINPRERYCIGNQVTVQLDMYDYLGKRKKYGGDLLRARIYSPDLAAGASGRITDFHNGTYHVQFTLFWAGKVKFTMFMIHPSEAVAALWRGRNTGYNYVVHKARYSSSTQKGETFCGYELDTQDELCNIMDKKDEYPFYCIKPPHLPCASITELTTYYPHKSYFTDLELPLLDSSRIRAEIPHGLPDLDVHQCSNEGTAVKEKCKTGMRQEFPGGYFLQNIWHPVSCSMNRFTSQDEINACIMGKSLRLVGDSTMLQWMRYFTGKLKTLRELNLYGAGWQRTHLVVDTERNIQIKFQKHGSPFIFLEYYSIAENPTIPEVLAQTGGNKNTVITFTAGAHFRSFPMHIFIRRVINIRRAIKQLLARSPETKIIIKTENTSYEDINYEPMSNFHGYIQYQVMNSLMKDLDIGTVDAWDMTTAFAVNNMHPPPNIIENEINLFLTFLC